MSSNSLWKRENVKTNAFKNTNIMKGYYYAYVDGVHYPIRLDRTEMIKYVLYFFYSHPYNKNTKRSYS